MYKTKDSAKMFSHVIAEAQCHDFLQSLSSSKYHSFLMDGFTDQGNVEEMIVILHCTKNTMAEEINTYGFYVCKNPGKLIQMDYLSALAGLLSKVLTPTINLIKNMRPVSNKTPDDRIV